MLPENIDNKKKKGQDAYVSPAVHQVKTEIYFVCFSQQTTCELKVCFT